MSESLSEPLRLLILGGGAIVTECHLPALRALGWAQYATVAEPSERGAAEVKARYPEVKLLRAGYQEALAQVQAADFDAVLIALPNTLHVDACERSLKAGLHVLCEKPLAMTAAECAALQQLASTCQRTLAVGMVRRYLPSLTALRQALAAGMVGRLLRVELEDGGKFLWPSDSETVFRKDQGGVLLGMGSHFLDYLEWLFGKMRPLSYKDDCRGGIEVNAALELETLSGLPISLKTSWTHPLGNALRVVGERGVLEMRKGDVTCCHWLSADGHVSAEVRPSRAFESGHWQLTFDSCFVEQFWWLAKAIRGDAEAATRLVTAEQAAHAHSLIEWAYADRDAKLAGAAPTETGRPALAPAQVTVTGGTGFVGGYLLERLTELGMSQIVVPVRSFRSAANAARYPVQLKRYDLLSEESCRAVVRGSRHVFHLAYGTGGAETARITTEGTRNMLQAALKEGVESVVVFSTCSVWGAAQGSVTETTQMQPALADYGESKAQMHRETLAFAKAHPQMSVSIVAPGAVYGPMGGLFCATACQMASAGTFAWFHGGCGPCNYVHVENLVDLTLLAASLPEAHAQDFIAVDGRTDWRTFFTPMVRPWLHTIPDVVGSAEAGMVQRRTGSLKGILRAALQSPEFMLALSQHPLLGWLKEKFTVWFPSSHQKAQALRPAPDYIHLPGHQQQRPQVASWLADIFGPTGPELSSQKAQQQLGWRPRVSLEQGQAQCVQWLRDEVRLLPAEGGDKA